MLCFFRGIKLKIMYSSNDVKFRAFDNRTEDWSEETFDADLDEEIVTSKSSLVVINTMYSGQSLNMGDQFTFQLSANMIDNDGVEIFEGDILEDVKLDGSKRFYKVFREKGGLVINTHQDDFYKPCDKISFYEALADMQTSGYVTSNCRVIGNIIDNPELLECPIA